MALTCFLFPVVGLTANGGASGPIIRLMPPLLGGVGNEDREGQDKTKCAARTSWMTN
jgi:hypothetical protein